MVLDASTLDSSEGALAAATHAIFIGGQEIAHKDGLKMGQPVHYWNKMPFAPGLYQASVGDKLSFLFNTEHTVWLMPSADASDSCDFTNAVELAGPTYGLPDWPELGSGDIKLGEANWPLSPLHQHLAGRLGRPLSSFDHDPPNGLDTGDAVEESEVVGNSDGIISKMEWWFGGRSTNLYEAIVTAPGELYFACGSGATLWGQPLPGTHCKIIQGDGQRLRRGGHAQPAAAVAAAAAAGAAARRRRRRLRRRRRRRRRRARRRRRPARRRCRRFRRARSKATPGARSPGSP